MALAFVLPAVQSCKDEAESALDVSLHESSMAAWVAPPYLVALVLAGVTVAAIAQRRSPGKAWAWLSAGLLGTGVLTSLTVPWQMAIEASELRVQTVLPIVALLGAAALCIAWIAAALRKRGWARWYGLLGAHALLAAPLGVFLASFGMGDELRIGGYAYLAALSALVSIQIVGQARIRKARSLRRGHAALAGIARGQDAHG
jgi:hypothetical protein